MYKHILFIEDETAIAEIYARTLNLHGFEVECRYDGETGLQEAQSNKYDLILLDLMLPNRSGEEILRTLRNPDLSPQFDQSTHIFMLTNFDLDDVTKREIMTMAQQYLIKVDITPKVLVGMLNELGGQNTTPQSPVAPTPSPTLMPA